MIKDTIKFMHKKFLTLNKWLLLSITGLLILCFLVFLYVNTNHDENMPISGSVFNALKISERIRIELNDSTNSFTIDSMKSIDFSTQYRLGLNRIKISLDDLRPIIDDTLIVERRNPAVFSIVINKPTDNSEILWKGENTKINEYGFDYNVITKSDSVKRVKFTFIYGMKD